MIPKEAKTTMHLGFPYSDLPGQFLFIFLIGTRGGCGRMAHFPGFMF